MRHRRPTTHRTRTACRVAAVLAAMLTLAGCPPKTTQTTKSPAATTTTPASGADPVPVITTARAEAAIGVCIQHDDQADLLEIGRTGARAALEQLGTVPSEDEHRPAVLIVVRMGTQGSFDKPPLLDVVIPGWPAIPPRPDADADEQAITARLKERAQAQRERSEAAAATAAAIAALAAAVPEPPGAEFDGVGCGSAIADRFAGDQIADRHLAFYVRDQVTGTQDVGRFVNSNQGTKALIATVCQTDAECVDVRAGWAWYCDITGMAAPTWATRENAATKLAQVAKEIAK